jgi:hypothetical protein
LEPSDAAAPAAAAPAAAAVAVKDEEAAAPSAPAPSVVFGHSGAPTEESMRRLRLHSANQKADSKGYSWAVMDDEVNGEEVERW